MVRPYSDACEQNREPILEMLRQHFHGRHHILEIGSGTGQHAVHFAAALPQATSQRLAATTQPCASRREPRQIPGGGSRPRNREPAQAAHRLDAWATATG